MKREKPKGPFVARIPEIEDRITHDLARSFIRHGETLASDLREVVSLDEPKNIEDRLLGLLTLCMATTKADVIVQYAVSNYGFAHARELIDDAKLSGGKDDLLVLALNTLSTFGQAAKDVESITQPKEPEEVEFTFAQKGGAA